MNAVTPISIGTARRNSGSDASSPQEEIRKRGSAALTIFPGGGPVVGFFVAVTMLVASFHPVQMRCILPHNSSICMATMKRCSEKGKVFGRGGKGFTGICLGQEKTVLMLQRLADCAVSDPVLMMLVQAYE
jgi:hypothetical protein